MWESAKVARAGDNSVAPADRSLLYFDLIIQRVPRPTTPRRQVNSDQLLVDVPNRRQKWRIASTRMLRINDLPEEFQRIRWPR